MARMSMSKPVRRNRFVNPRLLLSVGDNPVNLRAHQVPPSAAGEDRRRIGCLGSVLLKLSPYRGGHDDIARLIALPRNRHDCIAIILLDPVAQLIEQISEALAPVA